MLGTKLQVTFYEIVQKMVNKHKQNGRTCGNITLVISSFDGAVMQDSNGKGRMNIFLYSSQVFSHTMLEKYQLI